MVPSTCGLTTMADGVEPLAASCTAMAVAVRSITSPVAPVEVSSPLVAPKVASTRLFSIVTTALRSS